MRPRYWPACSGIDSPCLPDRARTGRPGRLWHEVPMAIRKSRMPSATGPVISALGQERPCPRRTGSASSQSCRARCTALVVAFTGHAAAFGAYEVCPAGGVAAFAGLSSRWHVVCDRRVAKGPGFTLDACWQHHATLGHNSSLYRKNLRARRQPARPVRAGRPGRQGTCPARRTAGGESHAWPRGVSPSSGFPSWSTAGPGRAWLAGSA